MAAMQKVFKCLSCSSDIRLERKPDNTGWNKFNLDGTEHKHEKKQQPQTQQKIEELTKQVSDLKDTVNILISQIQMLRSELKSKQ